MVRKPLRLAPVLCLAAAVVPATVGAPRLLAAEWVTNGPYGGTVLSLAIAPSNPATLYVTTFRSGVFKSTDGGRTWSAANDGLPLRNPTREVEVDPSTPDTVYAGSFAGVFKSTDGGASWADKGLQDVDVSVLRIDPASPSTLYAGGFSFGSEETLFKSLDGGETWGALDPGLPFVTTLALDPGAPTTLYASGEGVRKSTNGGAIWSSSDDGLGQALVLDLAIDPVTPSILYATTDGDGVFQSTDGGESWNPLAAAGLDLDAPIFLTIDPVDPSTLYAGGFASFLPTLYKSTDGGATWTGISDPRMDESVIVWFLEIDPENPEVLYAGSDGVFKSVDGGEKWKVANSGILGHTVPSLALHGSGGSTTLFAGTETNEVFRSTDGGGSWSSVLKRDVNGMNALAIDPLDAETVYAASNDAVYRSTDSGDTWGDAGPGLPFSPNVRALAINPQTPETLYAGTIDGVYETLDGAASWAPANAEIEGIFVLALAIDPLDPDRVYAGTASEGLFRSMDGGGTWSPINQGLPGSGVAALGVHPSTPSTLYAASFPGLFESTDGGDTWNPFPDLAGRGISALAIDAETPSTLYAGTTSGDVLKSTDAGASWKNLAAGRPGPWAIEALAVDPIDSRILYAATDGAGVFAVEQAPEPPAGPFLVTDEIPGFRFKVRLTAGEQTIAGVQEADCIGETLCVSGALPGRSELFSRIIGPRPNGFFWVNLVRFTPSRVEVWVEQIGTGLVNYYDLPALPREDTELTGLVDKEAFLPSGFAAVAPGSVRVRRIGSPGVTAVTRDAASWPAAAVVADPGTVTFTSDTFPGYRFAVKIFSAGVEQPVQLESDCIAETICVSGALPGRSELFLRIIGPRPNGFLWTNLVRFTTSRVEVEIEQLATGDTRTYVLDEVPRQSDELPGRVDKEAFSP